MSDDEVGFDVRRTVRAHGPELFGFALNACGDRALADDCVQETFVRAWQSRRRFDPERGSMRTWLFAIARNVVIDELRARARRPVADAESRLEHRQDPVGDHDRMVAHVTLVWALAQLSEAHRRVVVAVRLEGLAYEDLSRRDGVPVATLRTRMYHALRRLREILGEEA
ncbi:RNA polymerase sigma factor [Aeromicrobium halocynthiae]|uniref:RNA polymerase sigma factor n=1 Tax=Aeromicrobium halocynthiae TaxID=560557 RepID=UPI0031DA0672